MKPRGNCDTIGNKLDIKKVVDIYPNLTFVSNMNDLNALTEQEIFLREIIKLYKQHALLWKQDHPNHKNRLMRVEAMQQITEKVKELDPEVTEDFIKTKIESMRACFRKEHRKVMTSKETNPDDIYKPSLWYYNLFLFTVGEEDELNIKSEEPHHTRHHFIWTKRQTGVLISLYKKFPCLYSSVSPFFKNKRKRIEALQRITERLCALTGKSFTFDDVKKKISLMRAQYLSELRKIKSLHSKGIRYKSTLWCFELLRFMKDESKEDCRKDVSESESEEIKTEMEPEFEVQPAEDVHDITGDNLARNLREMSEEQRLFANKIIREVMYYGQMEQLSNRSKFILNGT